MWSVFQILPKWEELEKVRLMDDKTPKKVYYIRNSPKDRDEQGILTINILDFLLNPDSLDM